METILTIEDLNRIAVANGIICKNCANYDKRIDDDADEEDDTDNMSEPYCTLCDAETEYGHGVAWDEHFCASFIIKP